MRPGISCAPTTSVAAGSIASRISCRKFLTKRSLTTRSSCRNDPTKANTTTSRRSRDGTSQKADIEPLPSRGSALVGTRPERNRRRAVALGEPEQLGDLPQPFVIPVGQRTPRGHDGLDEIKSFAAECSLVG